MGRSVSSPPIKVGGRAFGQDQSGLPALLAGRSAPLGADDDGTTAEAGTPGPVTEARADLDDRLQRCVTGRGITDLERAVLLGGHPVDLLFTDAGENAAVLIDPGPGPGADPARHLRLTHTRGDLITGLPSGGHGAKPCPVSRTVRVPAWRIIAGEPEQPGPAARSAAGQTPRHVRHVPEAPRPQPIRRPAHTLARRERTVYPVTQAFSTDNHLPQLCADPSTRIRLFR